MDHVVVIHVVTVIIIIIVGHVMQLMHETVVATGTGAVGVAYIGDVTVIAGCNGGYRSGRRRIITTH